MPGGLIRSYVRASVRGRDPLSTTVGQKKNKKKRVRERNCVNLPCPGICICPMAGKGGKRLIRFAQRAPDG